MEKDLRKFGKFYSKIIMRSIGIFVFIGIFEVIFGPGGWMPHEDIYAISSFTLKIILPAILSYSIAQALSEHAGGIFAVLAVTGILAVDTNVGLLGALLSGMLCGAVWKKFLMPLKGKVLAGFEMLTGNFMVAVLGLFAALFHYFVTAPFLIGLMKVLGSCIDFLIQQNMLPLLAFLIEPAKILFLNNSMNYGGLIPLGMQQAEEMGNSVLFLLETNPGPGFGLLIALMLLDKKRRKEYGFGAFVQMVGGIHEVYFPLVLADLRLLFPLIAGGTAGILCFQLLGAGLAAPAAPGSILAILLVTERKRLLATILGILVSAVVSMLCSCIVLGLFGKKEEKKKEITTKEVAKKEVLQVRHIGFICDGGMGSSAMGASILRRKFKECGYSDIVVSAHAVDMIPDGIDLFVCLGSFYPVLQGEIGEKSRICTVDSLVDANGFEILIERIKEIRKNGGADK